MILFGILYILSPYLIKSRMSADTVKAEPDRFKGLEALPKDGSILFVTAHPDDLEFMAGGTLPKLLERGNDVYLVILTDGGKQRYTPAFYSKRIVETRRKEQLEIAEVEGLTKVFFITYPDGGLKYSDQAVEKVEKITRQIKTTGIFTFEPGKREGRYDSDHDASGQIGTAVAQRNNLIKGLYYFRPEEPDIIIDISDTFEKKLDTMFLFTEFKYKRRMLRALHESWDSMNGRRIGVEYGEAFRRVHTIEREKTPSETPAVPVGAGQAKENIN